MTVSTTAERRDTTQPRPPRRAHLLIAAVGYAFFVIYGSLVPFRFHWIDFPDAVAAFRRISWLAIDVNGRADMVANYLLYIPLGFLWLGSVCLDRPWHWKILGSLFVIPGGIALGVALEFAQIYFPTRTTSLNDVYAQVAGALTGTLVWWLLGTPLVEWARRYSRAVFPRSQLEWLLQAYALGLAIYSVLPLDLTITPREIRDKYRAGRITLVPFQYNHISISHVVRQSVYDVLVFVPVGALFATRPMRRRRNRSVAAAAGLTTLAAAAIELAQVFVFTRHVDTTDILLASVGGFLGATLIRRWSALESQARNSLAPTKRFTRREVFAGVLAALYSALILAGFWYPFDFKPDADYARSRIVYFFTPPLASLYWGTEFNAVNQVLLWTISFAPLGATLSLALSPLATTSRRRRIVQIVIILLCALVAMAIEAGQLWLPSHYVDCTSIPFCMLGGALGVLIMKGLTEPTVSGHLSSELWRDEEAFPHPRGAVQSATDSSALGLVRRAGRNAVLLLVTCASVLATVWYGSRYAAHPDAATNHSSVATESSTPPNGNDPPTPPNSGSGRLIVRPTDPLTIAILNGTGADWWGASDDDRWKAAQAVAGWFHGGELPEVREAWAVRYLTKIDELAQQPENATGRLADWLPIVHALLTRPVAASGQGANQEPDFSLRAN